MFAVEDIDDTVDRLCAHGAEPVGEVAQYEDKYRLCYMRGPAGIIVALARNSSEAFTPFRENAPKRRVTLSQAAVARLARPLRQEFWK
jgi:hypothetical protein